ncbi:chloroplastic import inner membrane translocase subunit HP30-2-like protein [Tanacetum coccineum]
MLDFIKRIDICLRTETYAEKKAAKQKAAKKKADESEKRSKNFKKWLSKQCLLVEAAVTTVDGAILGAIRGVILSILYRSACHAGHSMFMISQGATVIPQILSSTGGYQPLVQSFVSGGTLVHARNFAILKGVSDGISCVMRRFGSKEDIHTKKSLFADTISSLIIIKINFSRQDHLYGVEKIVDFVIITNKLKHCLAILSLKKAGQAEEEVLTQKRGMFLSIGIGLDHEAMNFKTGLSAATTRPLLTERKVVMN